MPHHFDSDLPRIGADKLKPMTKMWGGNSKMIKDECIACIAAGLKDPKKVKAAIAHLHPWERNALALIKRMGGVIPYSALKIGILVSGLHPPRTYGYRDDFIEPLFRRGLLMGTGSYSPEYLTEQFGGGILYSDDRLLTQVGFPEYQPLDIQPARPELVEGSRHGETLLYRRPSSVALDLMSMLQAIENTGGLKLTRTGSVRASDEAKLRKAMHWSEKGLDMDGFLFPDPAQAWLGAFRYSNLLRNKDDRLIVAESPEHFARRPFGEQVRLVMEGLIRCPTWWEVPQKYAYFDSDGKGRRQGRLALTLALSALPLDPDAFFSVHDFERALYQRIGEDFALDYPPHRPYSFYNKTPEQQRQELAAWQENTRSEWLKQEYPWLVGAFTTWLYFLGLVELGITIWKFIICLNISHEDEELLRIMFESFVGDYLYLLGKGTDETPSHHDHLHSICRHLPSDFQPYGERERDSSDCSSGYIHFLKPRVKLGPDWRIRINPASPRAGLLAFEHQGCEQFEPQDQTDD
jgi:hypothetical protein